MDETLNLKRMQRLWGRKITALAFSEFLNILEDVAEKKNKIVSYIDQWYPSTKACSVCDYVLDQLPLDARSWQCPSCSTKHGKDKNASVNILRVGTSTLRVRNAPPRWHALSWNACGLTQGRSGVGDVSQPSVAISVRSPESHVLSAVGVGQ